MKRLYRVKLWAPATQVSAFGTAMFLAHAVPCRAAEANQPKSALLALEAIYYSKLPLIVDSFADAGLREAKVSRSVLRMAELTMGDQP